MIFSLSRLIWDSSIVQYPRSESRGRDHLDVGDSGCGVHRIVPRRLQYNEEPWKSSCRHRYPPKRRGWPMVYIIRSALPQSPAFLTHLSDLDSHISSICTWNSSPPLLRLQLLLSCLVKWHSFHVPLQTQLLAPLITAASPLPPTVPSSR